MKFTKNVSSILPYDRDEYLDFFEEEPKSTSSWSGYSFQVVDKKHLKIDDYINIYNPFIRDLILKFESSNTWIVNHDDKDLAWFPLEKDNLSDLRTLFKRKNISNTFQGAVIFSKNDLLQYAKNILSYPYLASSNQGTLYKNLDISHSKLPFIIKITGHLCVDVFCKDEIFLKKIIEEENKNGIFKTIKYQ